MPVNSNKPDRWKLDITKSVDFYNDWFMRFAPKAYRDTRTEATLHVKAALGLTDNLTNITPSVLQENPSMLSMLRMATAPPIARDRLTGLAGLSQGLVHSMEANKRVPSGMAPEILESELQKIGQVIMTLVDGDLFPWLETGSKPTEGEVFRASTIVADRLCGTLTDPIIRNAQEKRQLDLIKRWLEQRSYSYIAAGSGLMFDRMEPGQFSFHVDVPVKVGDGKKQVKLPVDVAIMLRHSQSGDLPLLIEAKSAGDFTNPNKRRKEEATKVTQLRAAFGNSVRYILFLCGYFDSGYLGYEAAEGIDWVWEHRIDDLAEFGL